MKKVNKYALQWDKAAKQGTIILAVEDPPQSGSTKKMTIHFNDPTEFLLFARILQEQTVFTDGHLVKL
jgi:hypothetical protein